MEDLKIEVYRICSEIVECRYCPLKIMLNCDNRHVNKKYTREEFLSVIKQYKKRSKKNGKSKMQ